MSHIKQGLLETREEMTKTRNKVAQLIKTRYQDLEILQDERRDWQQRGPEWRTSEPGRSMWEENVAEEKQCLQEIDALKQQMNRVDDMLQDVANALRELP